MAYRYSALLHRMLFGKESIENIERVQLEYISNTDDEVRNLFVTDERFWDEFMNSNGSYGRTLFECQQFVSLTSF